MSLEIAYADGQLAALQRYKLGWPSATDPTVADSAVLQSQSTKPTSPAAQANMQPPTTAQGLSQIFDAHEQGKTRIEPRRKLSTDSLCTTCRKEKHYGSCDAPRKIPTKVADFNIGMRGDDPRQGDNPSTSPHYHAATTADSSLARARDAQPADVQAQTAFADLFRHLGISNAADEPGRMTGGLFKPASLRKHRKLADFFANMPGAATHSMYEQRGPGQTPNFYEEGLYRKGPPVGWGDEGSQRIERAFDQIDGAVDSTNIEDASKGQPAGGPVA